PAREAGAMAAMTLLSTTGLSRHFGGLRAVDNVDFHLTQGEVRAIIGPNGAGKSTFVGMICGRLPPTAGRIAFERRDITHLPAHRRVRLGIAYTFQITSIYGNLTAFDNVALAAQSAMRWRNGGPTRASGLGRRVGEALTRVGLADRAEAKASTLS